jgi:hypothetical protein
MKILTKWHLRTAAPRLEILLFAREGRSSMKNADHGKMSKKAFNSVRTSTAVVSADLSSPTSPIYMGKKHSRNHRTESCSD